MHLKERFDAFYGSSKSCQMGDMLDKWQICRSRHLVYRCIMPAYSFWVRRSEDDIFRKSLSYEMFTQYCSAKYGDLMYASPSALVP